MEQCLTSGAFFVVNKVVALRMRIEQVILGDGHLWSHAWTLNAGVLVVSQELIDR